MLGGLKEGGSTIVWMSHMSAHMGGCRGLEGKGLPATSRSISRSHAPCKQITFCIRLGLAALYSVKTFSCPPPVSQRPWVGAPGVDNSSATGRVDAGFRIGIIVPKDSIMYRAFGASLGVHPPVGWGKTASERQR